MPVRLYHVDPRTVAHPVRAADDVRQVDRLAGQRGQGGAQPAAFGRRRGVIVDRLVGGQGNIGDRVHDFTIPVPKPRRLG